MNENVTQSDIDFVSNLILTDQAGIAEHESAVPHFSQGKVVVLSS